MSNPPSMVPMFDAVISKFKACDESAKNHESNLKNISSDVKELRKGAASLEDTNRVIVAENSTLKAELKEAHEELDAYVKEKRGLATENANLKVEAVEWKKKYHHANSRLQVVREKIVDKRGRKIAFTDGLLEIIDEEPLEKRARVDANQ